MKKTVIGLLCLALVCLFVYGCGTSSSSPTYKTGAVTGVVRSSVTGNVVANATVNSFNGSSVINTTTNASGE